MTTRCCVGIDLGTTFSSLAYVDDENTLHSLRAEADGCSLASAVYFPGPDEEAEVGTKALDFSVISPERLARAFKRHMGDESYRFECDGRAFRAEELSAMVLKKLLGLAQQVIGPIDTAVISVPAYFDEARRQATVAAGRIAGLTTVDLINEPEAAALAYGHTLMKGGLFRDRELNELYGQQATILVYDLGGGTFDVTIAEYTVDGKFRVVATDGDVKLGGEDWDEVLLEWVVRRYYGLTGDPDPALSARRVFPLTEELRRKDPQTLQSLLLKCVEAKKTLSERNRASLAFTHEGKEQTIRIPVGDFERVTAHLVQRTEATTAGIIAHSQMTWSHFDRILLVGGSSRMPMIGKMMSRVTGRVIDQSLAPDTAIAQGAALYAALRSGERPMTIKDFHSVNAHALGLRIRGQTGGVSNDVLLPANQPTRTPVTRRYRVTPGKQWGRLLVLQGDDPNPEACVVLGQGLIHGLPADTAVDDKVEVTFLFQDNGMLRVTAVHMPRSGAAQTQVQFDLRVEGTLSEEDITAAKSGLPGIWMD